MFAVLPSLRTIQTSGLGLAIGFALALPLAAETLDEESFRATVVGTRLTGMFGTHITFQADGTIVGGMMGDEASSGTWVFEGGVLCTTVQVAGDPPVHNCGVPELTRRHFVVGGESGWRLRHDR